MSMNIRATRGDSETYLLTITEDAAPLDLTSAEIWMTVKKRFGDTDDLAVFQKTTADGITITDGVGGLATVQLSPADTAGLPARRVQLLYDVQVKVLDGRVLTPIAGTLTVEPDVTLSIV